MSQMSQLNDQTNTPPNKRARTLALYFLGVYFVVANIYVFYSIQAQTGLFGYLIALQMNTIGYADIKVTILLGLVLAGGLPLLCMIAAIEKFAPGLTGIVPAPGTPVWTLRDGQLTWKHVLAITMIPLLATVAIGSVLLLLVNSQNQRVYAMDLGDKAVTLPKDAVFVELNAVLARGYSMIFAGLECGTSSALVFPRRSR